MKPDYTLNKPTDPCSSCTLYTQPGPVWAEGDPDHAKVIYIPQNPGVNETLPGVMRPLVGASGSVFDRQCTKAGVPRAKLFITNQVKCLTPGNREPTEHEVKCCSQLLRRELDRCRADTVLLAGSIAFEANIGSYSTLSPDYHPSTSIFERMGCVEQRDGRKWIATPHPAFIMRQEKIGGSVIWEAIQHLQKAYAISGVKVPLPRILWSGSCSEEELTEAVERHRQAAKTKGIFADDIENQNPEEVTDEDLHGDDRWPMDMCGFSSIPFEAVVLPVSKLGEWKDIWADPSIIQAEHNGEHDRYYLEKHFPQLNTRFDTMYAHHLLHNDIHKYLKPECLRLYTYLPYYNRDLEQAVCKEFYNGMDNIATLLIAREQLKQLQKDTYVDIRGLEGPPGTKYPGRLYELYFGTAFPDEPGLGRVLPILEEQRRLGFRVDLRKTLLIAKWLQSRVERAEAGIRKLLGPYFNWRSYGPNGDVQQLFYHRWNLPPQYILDKKQRPPKKKLTCNQEAREKLSQWVLEKDLDGNYIRKDRYNEAAEYFTYADEVATYSKLLEFIGRLDDQDLRIHAMQKGHGTKTYRIASKPNTQNWPTWSIGPGLPSMRSIVIPDNDEDLLLVCDFDQVELWTYAAQFDIKYLLNIYNTGEYIYGVVYNDLPFGKNFFQEGKPRTKEFKNPEVQDQELLRAKAVPLGFLYGRAGESVAAEHGWKPSDGAKYREDWFRKNPELPKAHSWINYEMAQRQVLRPPPGMKLHYPIPDLQGLNCFGQTPAAILLLTSMIKITEEFKRYGLDGTRVVLSVHDAMAFNVRKAKTDPARMAFVHDSIVHPILSRPIPWLRGFQYRHSSKVGSMWDWEMIDYGKWRRKVGLD